MAAPGSILVVIGTRPEAIKLAPVIRALLEAKQPVLVCTTGQHTELLAQGLAGFEIPIHRELAVMATDQDPLTLCNRISERLNPVLHQEKPCWMIVQGDTASALASAMGAFHHRIPVAHVEAGLRTGDVSQPWPEEMYRRLLGRLAAFHFAPTQQARANLLAEGISDRAIEVTGNTVIDALRIATAHAARCPALGEFAQSVIADARGRHLVLVTVHRRENLGPPLETIGEAIMRLARRGDCTIVFPAHPNPSTRPLAAQLSGRENIRVIAPMTYFSFVTLLRHTTVILTDSGGIQEEATALGKPVLIMRSATERPETVSAGNGCLVGTSADRIVAETERLLDNPCARVAMQNVTDSYGDGHAAGRIVTRLLAEIQSPRSGHGHGSRAAAPA
jgi:UDP-N-acetylglucosamine 2-epimerase (non-hydrolysing)